MKEKDEKMNDSFGFYGLNEIIPKLMNLFYPKILS